MLKFLSRLFFIGFLLNFVWEITQMIFYSPVGMGSLDNYFYFLKIHWFASLGDAAMIITGYLIITLVAQNRFWFKKYNNYWILFLLLLPTWQALIEYNALHKGLWAYAPSMPLIFGIGVLPLFQMLILPGAALFLSRKYFKD